MENTQILPFYALWQELRTKGFDIALTNFMLLPEVLPALGVPQNTAGFCFLLQKLWLMPNMDAVAFDKIVSEFLNKTFKVIEENKTENKEIEDKNETQITPLTTVKETPNPAPEPTEYKGETMSIPTEQEFIYITVRRVAAEQNIRVEGKENAGGGHFLLKGNYFPLKENHLRQAGLYLKKKGKYQFTDRLDLNATIRDWAESGEINDLKYLRQRKTEILLLADDRGSMEAFGKMTELIYHSLQAADLKVHLRYFYNSLDTIYDNRYQMKGEKLTAIGRKHDLCIFIFSDAGATRGRYSTPRYEQNLKDFKQCLQISPRTVWLNPVPQRRWEDSTAGELSQKLPMFEASREGISAAVRFLAKK
jgi:uncharacterized protein with von Willebrand factor type A (vWA) domain